MNYYKILDENDTEQIVRELVSYLSIELDHNSPIRFKNYYWLNMYHKYDLCYFISIKNNNFRIYGNNTIEKVNTVYRGEISKDDIVSFFKYYNRKKVINEI